MSVFHVQHREVGFAIAEVVSHHPLWETSFDLREVCVGFVEDIVALGEIFSLSNSVLTL
jgi:hypothetical protein